MPHKIYQCCDSNYCTCGRAERLYGNNESKLVTDAKEKERQEGAFVNHIKDTINSLQKYPKVEEQDFVIRFLKRVLDNREK